MFEQISKKVTNNDLNFKMGENLTDRAQITTVSRNPC